MEKKHSKPEFQVIRQEAANAKFFVASQSVETTSSAAASYDSDGGGDVW